MNHLKFYWSPEEQHFACNGEQLIGHGFIQTDPTHDLVHLLVAANGNLHWQPSDERDQTCFAEYNAVLLEHILTNTFYTTLLERDTTSQIVPKATKYMHWFVSEHYAPFPVNEQVAFEGFAARIDPAMITRLAPYFFAIKFVEYVNPEYRYVEYDFEFSSNDDPVAEENPAVMMPEHLLDMFAIQEDTNRAVSADQHANLSPNPQGQKEQVPSFIQVAQEILNDQLTNLNQFTPKLKKDRLSHSQKRSKRGFG